MSARVHNLNGNEPSVRVEIKGSKRRDDWQPNQLSWTETPFLFLIKTPVNYWIRFRDLILRSTPFNIRVPFPCLKGYNRYCTLVELLLMMLAFGVCVAYVGYTYYDRENADVEFTGAVAMWPTALTFMLASRNSLFTFLLGIPFERQIHWHMLFACVTSVFGLVHGYLATWGPNEDSDDDDWLTGWIFQGAMSALIVFSLFPLRRYIWNIFYVIHVLLFCTAIVFGVIHEATGIMFGVMVWVVDVAIRKIYMATLAYPHECEARRLPSNVVRLTFPKGKSFHYSPGQYVFIMVPSVNVFEWHPFSISSSPHADKVSLHIRVLGNWTKSLHSHVSKLHDENVGKNENATCPLKIFIEGPYGAPMLDIAGEKYKLFLLISGGIGITPMQSICNQLLHEHESQGRPLKKIWFVWSVADKYMIDAAFEHDREWTGDTLYPPVNAGDMNRLPLSFQPDTIDRIDTDPKLLARASSKTVFDEQDASGNKAPVLHAEFYLTRVRSEGDFDKGNIKPSLQPALRFGRPKFDEIFTTMRSFALSCGESRVAVLACGPAPLVDDVRVKSCQATKEGVRFDFHSELFEF